jgi:hypothetical protein
MFLKTNLLILSAVATFTSPAPDCDNKFVHIIINDLKNRIFPNTEIEFVNELQKEENICEAKFKIPWASIFGYAAIPDALIEIGKIGDFEGAEKLILKDYKGIYNCLNNNILNTNIYIF